MREIYNFVICLRAENIMGKSSAISARLHIDSSSFKSIFNQRRNVIQLKVMRYFPFHPVTSVTIIKRLGVVISFPSPPMTMFSLTKLPEFWGRAYEMS
jgi:hypothetical protein